MRPLYISATLKDCGKTSVILGLFQILRAKNQNPGYIKPVGQHYVNYNGNNIDEDAVLIYEAFNFSGPSKHMSPIAIERGFTRNFIFNPNAKPLEKNITDATDLIMKDHPMILIEGTGHAGVGSCFGLSNARVAELTGSDVIIVTSGGIGRPIDEVALSLALFAKHNVNVLGVILNKVLPAKYDKVHETVKQGLKNLGTRLLGSIPYSDTLTNYTLQQIAEEFNYEIVCGKDNMDHPVGDVVVAAMEPQNVLRYLASDSLVITPGDRIDNILLSLTLSTKGHLTKPACSGGLILTGGLKPDPAIIKLLESNDIPVLATEKDTFTVTTYMKDLLFKIQPRDTAKIKATHELVEKYVDTDFILEQISD